MRRYWFACILVILLAGVSSPAVLAAPGEQAGGSVHYVSWGESLYGIAAQYGVTVDAILRQNGLTNPDMIYVGQPLIIPVGSAGGTRDYAGPAYGCASYHTVRMGETLSSIAWNYGTTTQALLQANDLYNQDLVYVGQQLCLPTGGGYGPQPDYASYNPAAAYQHVVAGGETLSGICARYRVDQARVIRANNLNDAGYIWAGQRLMIPGYQASPGYAAPAYGYPASPHYQPPAAPAYNDDYDRPFNKPPYKDPKEPPSSDPGGLPPAPDYRDVPAAPLLPETEHPLQVVVNGGATWADETYISPDPNSITTLIVQTGEEFGKTVRVRSGDYEVKGETEYLSGEFGPSSFAFRYIPPGDYDVWIDDPAAPSVKVPVKIEAGDRVHMFFSKQLRFQGQTYASPDGWYLAAWENPSKPGQRIGGWSNILVKTPASGLWVLIESEGGGYQAKCFTGAKGPGACDLAALNAGFYLIKIDGTQFTLRTYMDGNAYAVFEFARQPTDENGNKVGPVNYN